MNRQPDDPFDINEYRFRTGKNIGETKLREGEAVFVKRIDGEIDIESMGDAIHRSDGGPGEWSESETDAEPGRRWLDWIVYATWFGLGAGVVWLVGRWG